MIEGYYYLHTNGDLIYKPDIDGGVFSDLRDSDFVRIIWTFDKTDRLCAWRILIEATILGANQKRIDELVDSWECTDDDGLIYADKIGVEVINDEGSWCANRTDFINLAESPAGYGESVLEALAELGKSLDFVPDRLGTKSFADVVTA